MVFFILLHIKVFYLVLKAVGTHTDIILDECYK